MHETESPFSARWLGLTQRRFFLIMLIGSFAYHWLPGLMFPMLNFFPWWCLIQPNSTILSQLTGPNGFAMGLITLDWSNLSLSFQHPLIPPWWAYANMIVGFCLVGYLIIPILYYSNVLDWSRLPVTGSLDAAVLGHPEQRQASINTAFSTYLYFGGIIAIVIHTILFHGVSLFKYARQSLHNRQNDIHCTLISQYKEARGWLYGILFASTFTGTCLICHFTHLMPWYYMFVAVPLAVVLIIPVGVLQVSHRLIVYLFLF